MRTIARALGITLLLYCTRPPADLYRWVDANGQVHFSDRRPQDAVPVTTPDSDTTSTESQVEVTPTSNDTQILGPYSSFEIVLPGANEILIQETRSLSIALILAPPLVAGHGIDVVLDGTIVPLKKPATQFELTGTAFGSHRLQVRIRNAEGRIIARTPLHIFHLRKPIQPGQLH